MIFLSTTALLHELATEGAELELATEGFASEIELTAESFEFDYSTAIPASTIAGMITAVVISIVIPVLIFLYLRRRFRMDSLSLLYGIMAYLAGSSLAPNILNIGFQFIDNQTHIFSSAPYIYYAINAVLVAFLEFGAIYLGLKLIGRRHKVLFGDCLYFAFFFSITPILTQTLSYIGNHFSYAVSINQSGMKAIVENMIKNEATKEQINLLLESVNTLKDLSFFYYIMMALDVLLLLPMHASLSVIIGGQLSGSIPKSRKKEVFCILASYSIAVIVHSFLAYNQILGFIAAYLAVAVIAAVLGYLVLKSFMPEDLKKLTGKPDPSVKDRPQDKNKPGSGHKMPKIVMPKD